MKEYISYKDILCEEGVVFPETLLVFVIAKSCLRQEKHNSYFLPPAHAILYQAINKAIFLHFLKLK